MNAPRTARWQAVIVVLAVGAIGARPAAAQDFAAPAPAWPPGPAFASLESGLPPATAPRVLEGTRVCGHRETRMRARAAGT